MDAEEEGQGTEPCRGFAGVQEHCVQLMKRSLPEELSRQGRHTGYQDAAGGRLLGEARPKDELVEGEDKAAREICCHQMSRWRNSRRATARRRKQRLRGRSAATRCLAGRMAGDGTRRQQQGQAGSPGQSDGSGEVVRVASYLDKVVGAVELAQARSLGSSDCSKEVVGAVGLLSQGHRS